jgi:hypothetical protein
MTKATETNKLTRRIECVDGVVEVYLSKEFDTYSNKELEYIDKMAKDKFGNDCDISVYYGPNDDGDDDEYLFVKGL